MSASVPRHGVLLWCANCATAATFIIPNLTLAPGAAFRTRSVLPCEVCRCLDFENSKRVILTAADRRFLSSIRIAPSWGDGVVTR